MAIFDLTTGHEETNFSFPNVGEYFRFKVKTSSDVEIYLTLGFDETNPMYQVFIGSNSNTKSSILKNKTAPAKVEVDTPGILSDTEFRGFWLRWGPGVILVGKDGYDYPFMAWTDPEPFTINNYGMRTKLGVLGVWKFSMPSIAPGSPVIKKFMFDEPPHDFGLNEPMLWRDWWDATGGEVPVKAVVGGHDSNGAEIYVIRAIHNRMIIPGMLLPSDGCAYIAYGGEVFAKGQYQVLMDRSHKWEKKNKYDLVGSVLAGVSDKGEALFVARAEYEGRFIPGYTKDPLDKCVVANNKVQLEISNFEYLIK